MAAVCSERGFVCPAAADVETRPGVAVVSQYRKDSSPCFPCAGTVRRYTRGAISCSSDGQQQQNDTRST